MVAAQNLGLLWQAKGRSEQSGDKEGVQSERGQAVLHYKCLHDSGGISARMLHSGEAAAGHARHEWTGYSSATVLCRFLDKQNTVVESVG